MLVQAQASGQALIEEEIAFLADLGLPNIQTSQTVITHNAAYQANDLYAKTLLVNNPTSAKIALMENLSRNWLRCNSLSEHAYWKATSVLALDPSHSSTTIKVEDPKELPKAVEQHRLESRTFKVKINQVLSENERLLAQAIDKDIVKNVMNLSMNEGCETVNKCQKCLELKTELLNKKDFVDKETYDKLFSKSSKKPSYPKLRTPNQGKTLSVHMDLCGPIRFASGQWKKNILDIV
ncbi:hypothetical protein Tco_0530244 [Tanacetum coccineum]